MKTRLYCLLAFIFAGINAIQAQNTTNVKRFFPEETILHADVPYANDQLERHLMDIYTPPVKDKQFPLIVFFHGGAWNGATKHNDIDYMHNTMSGFIAHGYAVACVDYRYSTQASFPAQIQDCNQAIEYLYQHAGKYNLDKKRIAVMGVSAGGHLAALLGLSNNNAIKDFYPEGKATHFKIKCVLDYFGPADILLLAPGTDTTALKSNAIYQLLGDIPSRRPDLARRASPVTFVDKNDPPVFIAHGEKDKIVPNNQSVILSSWLRLAGVKNELTIVKDAPHFGPLFDTEEVRTKLFLFLKENFE
jgi:acetyl esterase/lipase